MNVMGQGTVAATVAALLVMNSGSVGAAATLPYACGGFALLGGAQLLCSHTDPKAPPQLCTFSWTLTTTEGALTVQEGSFLLVPGVSNATVYQGSGFSGQLSTPIILCQGKKSR